MQGRTPERQRAQPTSSTHLSHEKRQHTQCCSAGLSLLAWDAQSSSSGGTRPAQLTAALPEERGAPQRRPAEPGSTQPCSTQSRSLSPSSPIHGLL